jgi:phage/plasmid-like protein (TIGR03299 family)
MAHLFESGVFSNNEAAWHGLGVVLPDETLSVEQALEFGGLDWEVEMRPVYVQQGDSYVKVPSQWASTRVTDGKVFGITGERFVPQQNRETFGFVQNLLDNGDIRLHAAVALREGARVCLTVALNREINIGNDPDEKIHPFIGISNSHAGDRSLFCFNTPVRMVCANTENMAISGADRIWKGRHTAGLNDRAEEARRFLDLSIGYYDVFEQMANEMIGTSFSDGQFEKFLSDLLPASPTAKPDSTAEKNRLKNQEAILTLWRNSANLANIKGTVWGAYNAVTEYADHGRRFNKGGKISLEDRIFERQTGENPLKIKALELLTA